MNKSLKNTWLGLSLLGLLIGLSMIIWPSDSLKVICYTSGIAAILLGVFLFLLQWRIESKKTFSGKYILAVLLVAAGILLLIYTKTVLRLLGIVLGTLLLLDCLYKILFAISLKRAAEPKWKGILLVSGLFAMVGVLMLFAPVAASKSFAILCGVGLLVNCLMNIWLHLSTPRPTGASSVVLK